jgi:hypothetical protein
MRLENSMPCAWKLASAGEVCHALRQNEVVMEIVTSWMREGIQQGKHDEALALVLRLRRRRVGPLEAAYEAQIHRLSLEALEELSEALLDFTQVADVATWLQAHQVPS